MATKFNWSRNVSYNEQAKTAFHSMARARLRLLASALGMDSASYEIRSNKGGAAVSGEITLHHEKVYIQASQSCMGPESGIMYRTCDGRRDYTGGYNNFMPLGMLDDIDAMAKKVRRLIEPPRTVAARVSSPLSRFEPGGPS